MATGGGLSLSLALCAIDTPLLAEVGQYDDDASGKELTDSVAFMDKERSSSEEQILIQL